MLRKASTHGASAPSKSKTARSKTAKAKSKDKAAPRKEARKAASEAASKRTAAAAKQGGSPRRSRSRSLSPDDRPSPRLTYRDHSPGAESPVFDIPMITGSESDGDSPGSTKDPSSSQDAPAQGAPAQDAPVDDAESSETKAALTSSPAKNLTLTEGKARARVAKAASATRVDEGAAAAKKRAAPGSPTSEPSIAKGFRSLFGSSNEEEEEGTVSEPQEISNDLGEQQERYQAAQLQGTPVPPTPVYPRGYYPPDHLKAPRGLNHGRTSRGAYERALIQDEPLFGNDIEAARCVLLAPHRIPLKELTSLRKKPEDRGGLFPVWGYTWVQPENTTTQTQAEDLFWRWVSLKNFTVQELKELREDRLLSYVLDQRDLRIEFAHLIAKRQLHSVMEGLRQQSKFGAQDERGYGSVNSGTVHRTP
ncbi:ATP-binding cassette (ABC) Superfamily [Phytophthora palmivora]|uniref:ATP-binding cassette (ABC) Superfamily n=1 Tax=Phytophthora palmivora TaxID=4796 RepID=A0A2P4XXP9_9STRA|nr:ATP-binding cassette (ABC) Superfamily [Phytophthora palmivora]